MQTALTILAIFAFSLGLYLIAAGVALFRRTWLCDDFLNRKARIRHRAAEQGRR